MYVGICVLDRPLPKRSERTQGRFIVPGSLQNFNTENSFKELDKTEALKQVVAFQMCTDEHAMSGCHRMIVSCNYCIQNAYLAKYVAICSL